MNGGRESRRPRPALGCSAIDDDDLKTLSSVNVLSSLTSSSVNMCCSM
jgi:hypothetical protein